MGAVLSRWDGSAWQTPTAVNVWNGSAWVSGSAQVWDGSQWVPMDGGSTPTPPPSPPEFVGSTAKFFNGFTYTPDSLPGGARVLAALAWNTVDAVLTPPAGWTLVDEMVGVSSRSGVWSVENPSSIPSWVWDSSDPTNHPQPKVSGVLVGYTESDVVAHAAALDANNDTVHVAPALDISSAQVPATLVRVWWDKASTTTSIQYPSQAPERGHQYGTGGGSNAVGVGEDTSPMSSAGTAPALSATFNIGNQNAGGYTIALQAPTT